MLPMSMGRTLQKEGKLNYKPLTNTVAYVDGYALDPKTQTFSYPMPSAGMASFRSYDNMALVFQCYSLQA